jgi:hypothetical protein
MLCVAVKQAAAIFALAIATSGAAGCLGPAWSTKSEPVSPPPASLTVVRAGEVESRHPPLAALVVRIARSDLDLDPAQEPEVDDLIRRTNAAIRPMDEARILFLETLARMVTEDRYSPALVALASERLVIATEAALPKLESALIDLHAALSPRQRVTLVQILNLRIAAWAPTWKLPKTAAMMADEQSWIGSLASDQEPPLDEQVLRAMREDAIFTVRHWSAQTSRRVMELLPSLINAEQRRALSLELQLDSDVVQQQIDVRKTSR